MECNIRDVTSGVPKMACWGEFSIIIYRNMAYVQMAAASHTGEILSCLDTDPEFQHQPFQRWLTNEGLLSASRAVELVKMSKMYIYMYYLLVVI